MFRSITNNTAKNLSAGGTISGDVTISGDLTVNGNGTGAYDEIVDGNLQVTDNIIIDGTAGDVSKLKLQFHDDNVGLQRASGSNRANNGNSLYISAFEDIVFTASGAAMASQTERLRIADDGAATFAGSVGIGTSPSDTLHLSASVPIIRLTDSDTNDYHRIYGSNGGLYFDADKGNSVGSSVMGFGVDDSRVMTLLSGGNVGIGVDSPYNLLHIRKSAVSGSAAHDDDLLVIEETGDHCNINMISNTGSYLMWSDDTRNVANVNYQHGTGVMGFEAETDFQFNKSLKISSANTVHLANALVLGYEGSSKSQIRAYGADASTKGSLEFNMSESDGGESIAMLLDGNSRISLSNNDSGGSGNTIFGKNCADGFDDGEEYNVVIGDQAAESQSHDSTDKNVFIGYQASTGGIGSRSESIAIGYQAWGSGGSVNDIGGSENVFIGTESGGGTWATAASDGNTAVGWNTMKGAMQGATLNTAVGKNSFLALTKGRYNVAIGADSLYTEDVGDRTTAVGYSALYSQNSDTDNEITGNTGVGFKTGYTNVTGTYNTYLGYNAGYGGGSSSQNVAVGANSLIAVNDGNNNVTVGYGSGIAITSGDNNVAVGQSSLASLTTTDDNTAVGQTSLAQLSTGHSNTALGRLSGTALTTGLHNTAIGRATLYSAAHDEGNNVAIGSSAMQGAKQNGTASSTNREVKQNIAIGTDALFGGTLTGTNHLESCIAIGHQAMDATGANNQIGTVAIGQSALGALTSGAKNIAIGYKASISLTAGNSNIAIGYEAFDGAATGETGNIAIGQDAMSSAVEGASGTVDNNIAIGSNALYGGTMSSSNALKENIAIGKNAMGNTGTNPQTGTVAIGHEALTAVTSGQKNTAIGFESAKALLQGNRNTVLGYQALDALAGDDANNGGSDNIAIGVDAMGSLNAGVHNDARANSNIAIGNSAFLAGSMADSGASVSQGNVAIGHEAIMSTGVTPHVGTTAVGFRALKNLTSGLGNLAVGYLSLTTTGTGNYNTAVGHEALTSLPNGGDQNTALGWKALHGATSSACDNLTAIGYKAGFQISTGFNNTFIGANVDANTGNFDNVTAIGNNFEADASDGVFLGNTSVSVIKAQVTSITAYSSDERTKKDIKDYDLKGVDFIKDLQLKTYVYKNPADYPDEIRSDKWDKKDEDGNLLYEKPKDSSATQVGLIAQEVEAALAKHGVGNTETYAPTQDSGIKTLTYGNLIFPLIKAVQELSARVEELEKK